jgi:arsenite methyltransferase
MGVSEEFEAWAEDGRDREMEEHHWHTAKHALARIPVEDGQRVLDLGCGSGYAGRALADTVHAQVVGLDGAPEMVSNARSYTDTESVGYLVGNFGALPFRMDAFDHVWSMDAFFFARDPAATLRDLRRVLCPGGTFYCAVNYFEESTHTQDCQERIEIEMTRWSMAEYREAFREAGFHVAAQDTIPDRETEIPPTEEFPLEEWDSREAMVERYRTTGTLLTVGVVP